MKVTLIILGAYTFIVALEDTEHIVSLQFIGHLQNVDNEHII